MIHLDQKSFFITTTRIWNLLITRLDPDKSLLRTLNLFFTVITRGL